MMDATTAPARTIRRARSFKVRLSAQDCDRLYAVARRRGVMPEALIEALVRIVLREGLTNAVMDDDPTELPPLRERPSQ